MAGWSVPGRLQDPGRAIPSPSLQFADEDEDESTLADQAQIRPHMRVEVPRDPERSCRLIGAPQAIRGTLAGVTSRPFEALHRRVIVLAIDGSRLF
jgi:hypothetical protein